MDPAMQTQATEQARIAAESFGSAAAALNWWEQVGSRSGPVDAADLAYEAALRSLDRHERAARQEAA
jgi:hypothetical protein